MPVAPSIRKSIQAVRKAMTSPDPKDRHQLGLFGAIRDLFRQRAKIVANLESIEAVLALAPEIERFRGKGSQMAANEFARSLSYLTYPLKERLPLSEKNPDLFIKEAEVPPSGKDVLDCLEKLAAHAFSRTQGSPVRSRHAGELRAIAWKSLARIAEVLRRQEHLSHSLKVAADNRASTDERIAAVGFLSDCWGSDDPDRSRTNQLRSDAPRADGFASNTNLPLH